MQYKKSKQASSGQSNNTRHRAAASDKISMVQQQSHIQRPAIDRRSMIDVHKYSSNLSSNAGGQTMDAKTQHLLKQQQFYQQQRMQSNHVVRSDSPSQFDELDIDERHELVGDEDFGELNEFDEQPIEPTEYIDMNLIQSMHHQGKIGNSDSYHTLQNKYNSKKQGNSFAYAQSFAQAASNFSSPQSSTVMIHQQPMAQNKVQNAAALENNLMVRHNRFQNLMNNKHRVNNRQIKQVQTQKNSQVRQKINDELFNHGSPVTTQSKAGAHRKNQQAQDLNHHQNMQVMEKSDMAKKQIQMIQNLPPSVVLSSNKSKLQTKQGAGILSKALSTHVSPSASSASFIGQNGQNMGNHVKMLEATHNQRESKGSGHGKYKQGNTAFQRPGDFINKQHTSQTGGAKLKI